MTCQLCGKQEATVLFTHIEDSAKTTVFLCDECAAARGGAPAAAAVPAAADASQASSPPVAQVTVELRRAEEAAEPGVRCPGCGASWEDFRRRGRLGCSGCYEAFATELERLLRRIHGAASHRGKGQSAGPAPPAPAVGLDRLQQELERAVADEAYELAAQLRDRIRALEAQGARSHGGERADSDR